MDTALFITLCTFILVTANYYYYAKAGFCNTLAARLILARAIVGLAYITLFYYILFVWERNPVLIVLAAGTGFITFTLFDKKIKNTGTSAV